MLRAIWTTMRPSQWTKNLLVGAAPLAAGNTHAAVVAGTAVAFVAFCLVSSAVYCLNDIVDIEADRNHATKHQRPLAAGRLSVPVASVAAVVLAVFGVALALVTHTHQLWVVLLTYATTSAAYSFGFKRAAVIELALVSSGFLLRAVAGGTAAGLPISRWFLIVAAFGSLLLASGKRLSELLAAQGGLIKTRAVLQQYTPSSLRMIITISAGVTCTAYCLWAFEISSARDTVWPAVSVAPFVVAVLRYVLDADAGRAEAPDVMVLRDHVLQLLGLCWLISFAIGAFRG